MFVQPPSTLFQTSFSVPLSSSYATNAPIALPLEAKYKRKGLPATGAHTVGSIVMIAWIFSKAC